MSHQDCPGVPHECAGALARIEQALDGRVTAARAAQIRVQFEDCKPCLVAYEVELKVHVTLTERCFDAAPPDLRSRIGEALACVDLDEVDITDL